MEVLAERTDFRTEDCRVVVDSVASDVPAVAVACHRVGAAEAFAADPVRLLQSVTLKPADVQAAACSETAVEQDLGYTDS